MDTEQWDDVVARRTRTMENLDANVNAYQWKDGSDVARMNRARRILLLARDLAQAHGVDAMVVIQ